MSRLPALLTHWHLFLIISLSFIIGCDSPTVTSGETKSAVPQNKYEEYAHALASAEANSRADELDQHFKTSSSIRLDGDDVLHLNRFKVAKDGSILVCDFERKVVLKFDAQGRNKITIGGVGNEPGSHLFPTDVVETNDSSLAVPDFQSYRVSVFGNDGTFRSSFIYTPQGFSAQQLVFNDKNNSFYLMGSRWQYGGDGSRTGADLMHKYTVEGEYVGSFLQFPDEFKPLDLYNNSFPMTDTADGTIYTVLPFDYTVYQLTHDDRLSVFLKGGKKDFRSPQSKLDSTKAPRSEGYKVVQTWSLSYTPLVALVTISDKLIVQYQTFDPLRYTVDTWSTTTKKLQSTFKTNRLLLGRGGGDSLYFLNNLEPRLQDEYVISKADPK